MKNELASAGLRKLAESEDYIMLISKFGRTLIILSAVWTVSASIYLWPTGDAIAQAETRVYDDCMLSIVLAQQDDSASQRIEAMIEAGASANDVRNYLRSLGFLDRHMDFSDDAFTDPVKGGIFSPHPVLVGARMNKGIECENVASDSRSTFLTGEVINVAKLIAFGLLTLLLAMFLGRIAMRWISRGQ